MQPNKSRIFGTLKTLPERDDHSKTGDAAWKRIVDMHDDVARSVLAGFGGRRSRLPATRSWSSSTAPRAPFAAGWHSYEPWARSGSRSGSASTAAKLS